MNNQSIRLLTICGSTRANSSNHRLIAAITALFINQFEWTPSIELTQIPIFIPGMAESDEPAIVKAFRNQIRTAQAVLLCTPEYAHGVPGALKNAIDWTVGSGEFSHKPTALITASTDGRLGHAALLETLKVIECEGIDTLNLLIPFIQTRINQAGEITDNTVKENVSQLIGQLHSLAVQAAAVSNDIA